MFLLIFITTILYKMRSQFFIVLYADNFLPSVSHTVRINRRRACWPKHVPKHINKSLITIGKFLLLLTNYFNIVLDVFAVVFL
jgi:hypothetical protein